MKTTESEVLMSKAYFEKYWSELKEESISFDLMIHLAAEYGLHYLNETLIKKN